MNDAQVLPDVAIKSFFKQFGKERTNVSQLIRMSEILNIPNFDICMSDQVKNVNSGSSPINYPINLIVNLSDSSTFGSHWVCYYKKTYNDRGYYFDSYGGLIITKSFNQFWHN